MQNVSFMKEPLANSEKSVLLVIIAQKQQKDAVMFTIGKLLSRQKTVIIITLATDPAEILKTAPLEGQKNLFIVDCFSRSQIKQENVYFAGSPSELTAVQLAVDAIEKKREGEKTIVIDGLNLIAVYNNKETFGKFIHTFSNKMLLKGNSAIYFSAKESTDETTISAAKEFCSKSYDFSDMLMASITEQE